MALLTAFDLPAARAIGARFGLDVVSIEPLVAGSVNSNFRLLDRWGRTYFGRIYEEQDGAGALAEARLLRELTSAGVPVVTVLEQTDGGRESASHLGKPVAFYPWLEGTLLCGRMVNERHCRELGSALARVHAVSSRLKTISAGRFGEPEIRARLAEVRSAAPELLDAVVEIVDVLDVYSWRDARGLPTGLIHGDLFRDNVLWEGERILALLDFESASQGVFIYDLMVCVLAWCYRDAFDVSLVRALVEGYESVRPLTVDEREQAIAQGALACVRFATTRLTDFELRCAPGERPARDYRRFVRRLRAMEQGALDSVFGPGTTGESS